MPGKTGGPPPGGIENRAAPPAPIDTSTASACTVNPDDAIRKSIAVGDAEQPTHTSSNAVGDARLTVQFYRNREPGSQAARSWRSTNGRSSSAGSMPSSYSSQ